MNIEKYTKLHDELMKKLENGEITVETAKEVNDLAFEKYITEGVFDKIKKSKESKQEKKFTEEHDDEIGKFYECTGNLHPYVNDDFNKLLNKYAKIKIGNTTFGKITGTVGETKPNKFTKNNKGEITSVRLEYTAFNYTIPKENWEQKYTDEYFKVFEKFITELKDMISSCGAKIEYDTNPDGECIIYKDIG